MRLVKRASVYSVRAFSEKTKWGGIPPSGSGGPPLVSWEPAWGKPRPADTPSLLPDCSDEGDSAPHACPAMMD